MGRTRLPTWLTRTRSVLRCMASSAADPIAPVARRSNRARPYNALENNGAPEKIRTSDLCLRRAGHFIAPNVLTFHFVPFRLQLFQSGITSIAGDGANFPLRCYPGVTQKRAIGCQRSILRYELLM